MQSQTTINAVQFLSKIDAPNLRFSSFNLAKEEFKTIRPMATRCNRFILKIKQALRHW